MPPTPRLKNEEKNNTIPTQTPTLLLPNVPPKTLVGIDLLTFTSTPNFHGIRDLPPGWHFLYTGTTEGASVRVGGWFFIAGPGDRKHTGDDGSGSGSGSLGLRPEVLIWRWDGECEALLPLRSEEREEGMRVRANLAGVWARGGLFGFRYRASSSSSSSSSVSTHAQGSAEEEGEGSRDWRALTDRFSSALLNRITGAPGVDWEGRERWVVTSDGTARRDSDDIPGLEGFSSSVSWSKGQAPGGGEEREFEFVPVDLKMTWREGAIGRERTEAARDKSWALGDMIRRVSGASEGEGEREKEGEGQVLGELQFTFLMGLTLINYSCLQQWKRLLGLILRCRRAIVDRAGFMRDVLRLLLVQLRRCDDVEGGLFDLDGDDGGEFLRKLLRGFRGMLYEVLEDDGVPDERVMEVKREFERLEELVKTEFGWELTREVVLRKGMLQLEDGEEVEMEMGDDDEDEETGEYAPVVVDLGDTIADSR